MKSPQETGKVYLVGAGPGDPGLLTIKAKELIERADVIIYDRLANPKILEYAREGAELIYVGKQQGYHALSQDRINELIVKKAKEGKMVVRLKGGDPFIFGRGGEEAEECVEHGIPFEVVPGVTSAISVPAYSGIPLTHRNYSASVTIVTGHRQEQSVAQVNWEGISKIGGTLVFLMGMSNLENITRNLIKYGMSPDTPAAVIHWGTTCHHRTAKGSLKDIHEIAQREGMKPPSIIVVGDVVRLSDKLRWFESRPLLGKNILVTRAREQASELLRLLESYGACCLELPTIQIKYPEDLTNLDRSIHELNDYDYVIFSSPNAVNFFLKRLLARGYDVRVFAGKRLAVIGRATADELTKYFLQADIIPTRHDAEGLCEALKTCDLRGKRVLIPQSSIGRDVLQTCLEEYGALVTTVVCYVNERPELAPNIVETISDHYIHYVTFTSSSTVKNLVEILPEGVVNKIRSEARVVCIGQQTKLTAEAHGFVVHLVPDKPSIRAMVDVILQDCLTQPS